jgi:hypothetical protein
MCVQSPHFSSAAVSGIILWLHARHTNHTNIRDTINLAYQKRGSGSSSQAGMDDCVSRCGLLVVFSKGSALQLRQLIVESAYLGRGITSAGFECWSTSVSDASYYLP